MADVSLTVGEMDALVKRVTDGEVLCHDCGKPRCRS